MKPFYLKVAFFVVLTVLLATQAAPYWGLFLGLAFCLTTGAPFSSSILSKVHKPMLKVAVVGLGFGLNIDSVISTGREGVEVTLMILGMLLVLGWLLAKLLNLNMRTAMLITSGTAICGGSAIAAMSPIVSAKDKEISVAMGVVFLLNAIALLLFPIIGRWLGLNGAQFAWWSAMAIHDTSSVVGAASQFGNESLALATTIKLTRALWILPVSIMAAVFLQSKQKAAVPYFILWFAVAAAVSSYVPVVQSVAPVITQISKSLFTIVLFLIGVSLEKSTLREVGFKPVIYGTTLWIVTAITSLLIICGCCKMAQF